MKRLEQSDSFYPSPPLWKDIKYEDARYRITELAGREAQRFSFLSESDKLSDNEKEQYQAIVALHNGKYSMDENILTSSIYILSHLLHRHYGQKTVIIIDEYDVPLDKAFQNGYYREMVSLIRGLFGMALKTNDSLQFAVLTGCLRISKESIVKACAQIYRQSGCPDQKRNRASDCRRMHGKRNLVGTHI